MIMTSENLPPKLTRDDFDTEEEYQSYLAVEAADFSDLPPATDDEKALWKALAVEHIAGEREKISLNVPKRNLSRIKARALEQGLPYQTLINAVLQQWLRGDQRR